MTDDFFRARTDQMIDLRHPLAVLAQRLPWEHLEQALARALPGTRLREALAQWHGAPTCSARSPCKSAARATPAAPGLPCACDDQPVVPQTRL